MTKLLPDVQHGCLEYHPTLPLVVIGTQDAKVVVFNWQTNRTVAQLQLHPSSPFMSVFG